MMSPLVRGGFAVTVIKPGHTLKITIVGHSEFTQKVTVSQDGTIEYPLLSGIAVDGLTTDDVRDLLRQIMIKYDSEPEVFVILSKEIMVQFQVQGEVFRPGKYTSAKPVNLQQALVMAGNVTANANIRSIHIFRIEDDHRTEYLVDMLTLFRLDSLILAPEVLDGDLIVVGRQGKEAVVRIVGEVNMPGSFILEPETNIYDAILQAGGFTNVADQNKIVFISNLSGNPKRIIINLREELERSEFSTLPLVYPGDLIVVHRKPIYKQLGWWSTTIQQFSVIAASIVILINLR